MSVEIIRFIRALNYDCEQTDFPTIAFLSAQPADLVIDKADVPPVEPIVPHETQVAKTLTEIRSLARSHTRTALNVLVGIMRSKDATPAARVSAANAILDRGWGKAPQAIENGGDGQLELVHRIERVIVNPENSNSEGL
jgi:hypothetical protein